MGVAISLCIGLGGIQTYLTGVWVAYPANDSSVSLKIHLQSTNSNIENLIMSFFDLIQKRYSCRAYLPDAVEEDKLLKVLNAARMAPSATNLQPYQFIVIRSQGREEDLKRIYYQPWFVAAPIVICACALTSKSWVRGDGRRYGDVDVAIAMDHLTLAATELGLGTCWVASFDIKATREILGIPYGIEPIAFTPLGYPADEPGPKERKALSELVRYEHW